MSEAFANAKGIAESWVAEHGDGFPPIIINVTDGESTDGDPEEIAEEIKSIETTDGKRSCSTSTSPHQRQTQLNMLFY